MPSGDQSGSNQLSLPTGFRLRTLLPSLAISHSR